MLGLMTTNARLACGWTSCAGSSVEGLASPFVPVMLVDDDPEGEVGPRVDKRRWITYESRAIRYSSRPCAACGSTSAESSADSWSGLAIRSGRVGLVTTTNVRSAVSGPAAPEDRRKVWPCHSFGPCRASDDHEREVGCEWTSGAGSHAEVRRITVLVPTARSPRADYARGSRLDNRPGRREIARWSTPPRVDEKARAPHR